MKKQLPTYRIDGHDYWVDLRKNEFRLVEWPNEIIPFHFLTPCENGYQIIYDKAFDLHTNDYGLIKIPGRGSVSEIPPLHKLDPIGMERNYGAWTGNWEKVNDIDWILGSFLKHKTLDSQHPIILIDGHEYSFDSTGKRIIAHDNPKKSYTKGEFFDHEVFTRSMEFFDLIGRKNANLNKNHSFKNLFPPYCVQINLNNSKHQRKLNDLRSRPIGLREDPRLEKLISKETADQILLGYAMAEVFKLKFKAGLGKFYNKELPLHKVDHTEFEVNLKENCIQAKNNRTNRISFDQMNYVNGHYEFRFDRITQRQAAPFDTPDQDIAIVKLPGKNLLDPDFMATKYNLRIESISSVTDFDIQVPQDHFRSRMNGDLPMIKADQHRKYAVDIIRKSSALAKEHLVDFKKGKMISQQEGCPDIKLPQIYDHHEPITFFYDLKEKNVTELKSQSQEYINENILGIMLPPPVKLDPVYTAGQKGWDIKSTLLKYPIDRQNYLLCYAPPVISQKLGGEIKKSTKRKNTAKSTRKKLG